MTNSAKERRRIYSREWYLKHKEITIARAKLWIKSNPDYRRPNTPENRIKRAAAIKRCKEKHKEKYRISNLIRLAKRNRIRRATQPQFKIAELCRGKLNKTLRAFRDGSIKRVAPTEELVGCSFSDLVIYLEARFAPGMNWGNHGSFGWHIDHIKPISSFNLSIPEEQRKCFHFSNLQPLWWKENNEKRAKIL